MKRWRSLIGIIVCLALLLPWAEAFSREEFQWDKSELNLLAGLMETDIQSIQEAYAAGILTCRQVTEYYLERIHTYNDTYNCFITLCDDALEQADAIDRRIAAGDTEGLLFGIPMVIKDNIDYAGYHTTNGYAKRSSQIADSNATVVEYLLREGAVILGKTNMSTEAQDAKACYSQAVGETKNAYSPYLASGASSGGSAVATALNFAVAGLGTDTNSSLRLPAVLNGCVSLRVTWDSIPMEGIVDLNARRDVAGTITRTVRDQAIILDALSGGETSYAENLNGNVLKGLRLGIIEELVYEGGSVDKEVIAAFKRAVKELEACGAEVVEVSVPGINSWISVYDDGNAFRERKIEQLEGIMEEKGISAFLFPSYLSSPQYSGRDENGKYWSTEKQAFLNNTSKLSPNVGVPEIGIPIGYHSRGAGIGMEIAAGRNQEQLLLDIAYSYTLAYDHRQVPEGPRDLYTLWYEGTLSELTADYFQSLEEYTQALEIAEQEKREAEASITEASTTEASATEASSTEYPAGEENQAPAGLSGETGTGEQSAPAERSKTTFRGWLALLPVAGVLLLIPILWKRKEKRKESIQTAGKNK